jgi:hypothetical protein
MPTMTALYSLCENTYSLHQDSWLSTMVILLIKEILVDEWQQWVNVGKIDIKKSILVSARGQNLNTDSF